MMKSTTIVSSGNNSSSNIEDGLQIMMKPLRHSSSSVMPTNDNDDDDDDMDPAEKNKGQQSLPPHKARSLLAATAFWIAFAVFGWYFPRLLISWETSIQSKVPPFQETAAGDVILDFLLNQPLVRPATVDSLLLKSTAIYIPFVFLVLHAWFSRPAQYGRPSNSNNNNPLPVTVFTRLRFVCTAVSAFAMAIGLSEGTTVMIKLWVQRRRPNFYALCGFDISTKTCQADLEHVREANFSFPSGHSSLICCGMTFLVWYLHGHYNIHSASSHPKRIHALVVYTCLPWGWALFVAASRLVDHWHHPSDVIAGLGLGFATSTIAYHVWYPVIWNHGNAGLPRSMMRMGRAAGGSRNQSSAETGNSRGDIEGEVH